MVLWDMKEGEGGKWGACCGCGRAFWVVGLWSSGWFEKGMVEGRKAEKVECEGV